MIEQFSPWMPTYASVSRNFEPQSHDIQAQQPQWSIGTYLALCPEPEYYSNNQDSIKITQLPNDGAFLARKPR
jgi:hypothetical protein